MAAGQGEGTSTKRLRCQRIGCESFFTEDDNVEGGCVFHPGPIFHDGTKEWSCCKARSYDFSLFLALPGCQTGRHTAEKPQTPTFSHKAPSGAPAVATSSPSAAEQRIASPAGAAVPLSSDVPGTAASLPRSTRAECQRCSQNLYCTAQHSDTPSQDSGAQSTGPTTSQPASQKHTSPTSLAASQSQNQSQTPKPPKWDLNAERTCTHAGCGIKYREKDNQDSACAYHPGPASFHDRKRGWTCCGVFVNEFDEFLSIPPCTRGWHDDDA